MPRKYSTLPYLFGFPFAGTQLPRGLQDRLNRDQDVLRGQSGAGLGIVFDFPLSAKVVNPVHHFACDVTRDPLAVGEAGPVRLKDWDDCALYSEGNQPDEQEIATLIETYHKAFHLDLQRARKDEDLIFHLQIHPLEAIPPVGAPDRIRFEADESYRRPHVVLANNGGPDAGPAEGTYTTCPKEHLAKLAALFYASDFKVQVNQPFLGEYDIQLHGKRWYAGIGPPVLMLAVRTDLFLSGARGSFDPDLGTPLKVRMRQVLEEFADYLLQDEVSLSLAPG